MQVGASLAAPGCGALIHIVEALEAPFGIERSVKLVPGALLTERVLVSVHKSAFGAAPAEALLAIAETLGMPNEARPAIIRHLPTADVVHLGLEEGGGASVVKIYMEFSRQTRAGLATARQNSRDLIVHRAVKWDRSRPGHAVLATYTALATLGGTAVAERMIALFAGRSEAAPCRVALNLFNRARGRTAASDLLYMEVEEEGTDRQSFDLRLYDAGLVVSDIAPFSAELVDYFSLSPADAAAFRQCLGAGDEIGHVSGGLGRDGREFLTIYFGVRAAESAQQGTGLQATRAAGPVDAADRQVMEWTAPDDRYTDYCLWDYRPIAPSAGKLRGVSLLWHALDAPGADPRLRDVCRLLRRELGQARTVWGIKHIAGPDGGRLAYEFYFYDYERLERTVSMSRVLTTLSPLVRCDLQPPEQRPYFMFSIELDDDIVSGRRPLEQIDLYVGNPGSTVSSGICYSLEVGGIDLKNFYFFFDADREMPDIVAKIACSAHVDLPSFRTDDVVWPELASCKTIVVANKRRNDGIYFSRIGIGQLCQMLERTEWPSHVVDFARAHRPRLDHLLFDVGFDYVMRNGSFQVVRSAIYGTL